MTPDPAALAMLYAVAALALIPLALVMAAFIADDAAADDPAPSWPAPVPVPPLPEMTVSEAGRIRRRDWGRDPVTALPRHRVPPDIAAHFNRREAGEL